MQQSIMEQAAVENFMLLMDGRGEAGARPSQGLAEALCCLVPTPCVLPSLYRRLRQGGRSKKAEFPAEITLVLHRWKKKNNPTHQLLQQRKFSNHCAYCRDLSACMLQGR